MYVVFLTVVVIGIIICKSNASYTADDGIFWIYSMTIPVICIVAGAATRFISSRLKVFLASCGMNVFMIMISMYLLGMIYNINFGVQNLGISYVASAIGYMLVPYVVLATFFAVKNYFRDAAILRKAIGCRKLKFDLYIMNREHRIKTTSVQDPYVFRAYNKVTNRMEKYLIWMDGDKMKSSARIIWIDRVDLAVVTEDKKIYACNAYPKKIGQAKLFQLKG